MIEVLTLSAGYNTSLVLIGTTLLGIAAGSIGVFTLLRERALVGDALAHSSLPGLAAAFIFGAYYFGSGKSLWLLLLGAAISGILGVICIQAITKFSRLDNETAIGIVLSCFFGLGIVLLSIIQSLGTGEEGGLHHFIFGQTAAMIKRDAYLLAIVAFGSLVSCFALTKEFALVCFDEEFASVNGWRVQLIDFFMMSQVVVVTVVGLQAVGLLLIVALLIIPAAASRFWTNDLRKMLIISSFIGGLSGYLGAAFSASAPNLPAGAVIVSTAGLLFLVSFFCAPARGLLAGKLRERAVKGRIELDHFLRDCFEESEKAGVSLEALKVSDSKLQIFDKWSNSKVKSFIKRLQKKKLITPNGLLTKRGAEAALQKVRNHRLWEEYLVSFSAVSSSHVDYSADLVEHVLSEELVERLEEKLAKKDIVVPDSVHPLE